jgi:hypothetical protein
MLIPMPMLAATLPYARVALGAFVGATAWCGGQYATARLIRRFDKEAFDGARPAPMTKEERLRHLQLSLLTTAAGPTGSLEATLRDPDVQAALRAMDRLSTRTPTPPANDTQAAAEAA